MPQLSPPPKSKEELDAANMLTEQERAAWLSRRSSDAERSMETSCLMANAFSVARLALIAGLLAAWPSVGTSGPGGGGSLIQMPAIIVVQLVWLLYLVAIRPFSPVITLLCELLPSTIELVIFCLAASQALSGQAVASSSVGMMVLLLIETGFVTILEAARAWDTNQRAWRYKALMAEEEQERHQESRRRGKKSRRRKGRNVQDIE